MLTTTTLQKIEAENLNLFKHKINSMKTTPFNINHLKRLIRPFCRTSSLDENLHTIKLKYSKKSILFNIKENPNDSNSFNISINYTSKHKSNIASFLLVVSSNKEFLNKVVNVYELFN